MRVYGYGETSGSRIPRPMRPVMGYTELGQTPCRNLSQCGPGSQPKRTNIIELIEQAKKRFGRLFAGHRLELF